MRWFIQLFASNMNLFPTKRRVSRERTGVKSESNSELDLTLGMCRQEHFNFFQLLSFKKTVSQYNGFHVVSMNLNKCKKMNLLFPEICFQSYFLRTAPMKELTSSG
jgi:hypothetical protein